MQRLVLSVLVLALLLCLCDDGHAAVLHPYPTAKLTVSGAVQPGDNGGNIQVDFNGFVEVIHYGPFSTASSLASGLAAMFSRDFIGFGLYAKAGANNGSDPTVVTFQLTNGSTFGVPNLSVPSTSFSFSESGFGGSASGTPDVGTVALQFNGATIATARYGEGSTSTSIVAELVQTANSGQVTVTAEGPNLYFQTKQTGTFSAPYSLVFTSTQAGFSQSSFSANPASGTLTGSSGTSAVPIYSYSIPSVSGYDATGKILNVSDSVMGAWSYGYDNLNRLTTGVSSSGTYSGQSVCWSYDTFGNRTSQAISTTSCGNTPPATFAAAYNANNQIALVSVPAGISISYDAAGNMTNDGYNAYLYDAEGRLCAMHGPQGMVGYLYNAEGSRVGKGAILNLNSCDPTQNGFVPTNDYVLDQSGGQMAEVVWANGTSTPQHTNVVADGVLIATADIEGWHFHLNDSLGSRRVQTDAAGFPEQICQSLAFGDQLFCTGSVDHPTEHHFTGKERDTESGLDYFGARYMSSNMGRFMSPDFNDIPDSVPYADFDNPQSLNLYSYVRNNPLSSVDPDGHDCVVQSRVDDNHESVSVSSGNCDGVKLGSGQSATYVAGTVTGISANGGNSIDIGYNSYDGQSSGVTNSRGAPGFDHPGIDGPANAAIFGQIGNGGMAAIKYFTIGSAIGGVTGGLGLSAMGTGAGLTTLAGEEGLDLAGDRAIGRMLGDSQRQLIRDFFKSGKLPEGLSQRSLKLYAELAKRAIAAGKDGLGVQAQRLAQINSVLH